MAARTEDWWKQRDRFQRDAQSFVRNAGISEPPVDPMVWCGDREFIRVRAMDLRGECDGLLRFRKGRFHLFYDPDPYRGRFSFAHEVAHYLLEDHATMIRRGTGEHSSEAGFVCDRRIEREADWFASGLLMPRFIFEPRCPDPNFKDIGRVAGDFEVSLSATVLRTVQFTRVRTAVIVTRGGEIAWGTPSEGMIYSGVHKPKTNREPPRGSKTAEVAASLSRQATQPIDGGKCFASEWFYNAREDPVLWEQVLPMPRFGQIMTLLTFYED